MLHTAYAKARKAGIWVGINPLDDVKSRRAYKKVHPTLRDAEVAVLLPHVPDDWQDRFATAIYTGMRKGELIGLLKSAVDLENKSLMVSRSYGRETTKGGHIDAIPIADPLLPYLKHALESSKGKFVFPDASGNMRTLEADPQKILKHALGRAGLVEGYEHTCRRCKAKGKPYSEHSDSEIPIRPVRGMKLWPKTLPRKMRFHDLRHITATLLLRAGVDLHRVQRMLRHKDLSLTADTYGHLEVDDLRAAINKLPATPKAKDPTEP